MTTLSEGLSGIRSLAVDTAPFIYLVESHPQFAPIMRGVIRHAERGELSLVTSVLTLTEVLTLPLAKGADELVQSYRELLLGNPLLRICDLDVVVAFQLAVAETSGCEAFLTNDTRLGRVTEPNVLLLSSLEVS